MFANDHEKEDEEVQGRNATAHPLHWQHVEDSTAGNSWQDEVVPSSLEDVDD